MVLFADGGLLASKPYAAGGAYIDRMSNYCSSCRYQVKLKNGPDACPFNYLYWDFLIRHRDKLNRNPRLGMIYRTLDKMDEGKQQNIKRDAQTFLNQLS
jgi:deoxyribodipyrimidine photolyase-related protein